MKTLRISIVLAVTLAMVSTGASAGAGACVQLSRVDGDDPSIRAAELAKLTHPHGAASVVLARDDAYPDALAGGPLAVALDAPIIFTTSERLAPQARAAIDELGATRAVLLGAEAALAPRIAAELAELGVAVQRIGGSDRWATAGLVADRLREIVGGHDVVLAVGGAASPTGGWPDAVAASAFAASQGQPILLTGTDALPDATASRLPLAGDVTIVGGTAVIAPSVEELLLRRHLSVHRLAGEHRFATSEAVVAAGRAAGADGTRSWVTDGTAFQEPLMAGPAAAAAGGVLRLIDPTAPPALEGSVVLVGPLDRLPAAVVGAACPPSGQEERDPTQPTTSGPAAPRQSDTVQTTTAAPPRPSPAPGPAPEVTPPLVPEEPAPTSTVRYVRPRGTGNGTTWGNAASLTRLPALVAASAPGDEIWVRGDEGPYRISKPIVLRDGGAPGQPVTIRGTDATGQPVRPRLLGTRAAPWTPGAAVGNEVFRLLDGADHLAFTHLDFANIGDGAFRIGADITDLTIEQMSAVNVRRFLENYASGTAVTATIRGLTLRDIEVTDFTRGVVRLGYDSSEVLLEDVTGDSQRHDGDPFAMGVHLTGTVHEVTHRRVTMRNAHHDNGTNYWNGDGFVAEGRTHHLTYEDTIATGNTDAGYDLKATNVTMIRPTAGDNKRNYRFWGRSVEVRDCTATTPSWRGGSGSQAQVWAGSAADVVMVGCSYIDNGPATVTWHVEDHAHLNVNDFSATHHPDARPYAVEPDASLTIDGTPTR